MGRRFFSTGSTTQSQSSIQTEIANRFEGMYLNGLQRITEQQQEIVAEARESVRNHVTVRMGEMLLQGQIMLNAYCDLCSGILMESRQGFRRCVTCELTYAELLNRGVVAPTTNGDAPDDSSDVPVEHDRVPRENELSEATPQFSSEISAVRTTNSRRSQTEGESSTTPNPSCQQLTMEELSSYNRAGFVRSVGVASALRAVDDKLKWCAEQLDVSENLNEVLQLYRVIDCGLGILNRYMNS